jgi:hypoxanthine phosphoribosyltransferase
MTGSVVLLADLIRLLDMPLRVGVVQARSYRGNATTPGQLSINSESLPDIAGRHVLVVDDIFDTGHTLFELLDQFDAMNPASLRSAVLLRKKGRQQVAMVPDHVAFEIPDEFVVGYGLDYRDEYRNLPHLAALESIDLAQEAGS